MASKRNDSPTLSAQHFLGADGPLANSLDHYHPRQQQIEMANVIESTIESDSIAIIEASTGTGKTFAYLIPALLSQKKIIISTGTKTLQDQLFFRDLPSIKSFFPHATKTALLKGRANYLCKHRIAQHQIDARFISPEVVAQFSQIENAADQLRDGDISQFAHIPEDSSVWPFVTSTSDNCLGSECEFYEECFLVKARKSAMAADVVIVNHHLFFADLAIREEGFGELLPNFQVVIFDEAHQLPEIASHFFGRHFSSRQVNELINDVLLEADALGNDMPQLRTSLQRLEQRTSELRSALGNQRDKGAWSEIPEQEQLNAIIDEMIEEFSFIEKSLDVFSSRSKGLESCFERSRALHIDVKSLAKNDRQDVVHWYEAFNKSFTIHHTPLQVGESFKAHIEKEQRSWIFTSATLAIENDFSLFAQSLGLENFDSRCFASPFDFANQALLYLPRGLCDPANPDYTQQLISSVIPLIKQYGGRTFLLFTSYRALHEAANILKNAIRFPLLIQGEMPKRLLLNSFIEKGDAVLLGTMSFWEGVDVRGSALSCVVIDKLPFASPDDPLLRARSDKIKQQGVDPFDAYQLPAAIMALRQGVGRLIRDQDDRGIVVIADPRLPAKRYGERFLASLPSFSITRDAQRVLQFIDSTAEISEELV